MASSLLAAKKTVKLALTVRLSDLRSRAGVNSAVEIRRCVVLHNAVATRGGSTPIGPPRGETFLLFLGRKLITPMFYNAANARGGLHP